MRLTTEQKAALKREILRTLDEERLSIVRRAAVQSQAVDYVHRFDGTSSEMLNVFYAEFDNFASYLSTQELF